MLNFPSSLGAVASVSVVKAVDVVPVIKDTVTFRRPEPSEPSSPSVGSAAAWTPERLMEYVVQAIERIHGPFPRDEVKEGSIFAGFVSRWGRQAGPIAQRAFGDHEGMWRGAPVRIQRFLQVCDPYFAAPLVQEISAVR